jgi:hypothetical protein
VLDSPSEQEKCVRLAETGFTAEEVDLLWRVSPRLQHVEKLFEKMDEYEKAGGLRKVLKPCRNPRCTNPKCKNPKCCCFY